MAKNMEFEAGLQLPLKPTLCVNATPKSGDAVCCGKIPGVMLVDSSDTIGNGGQGAVKRDGVFSFVVEGKDASGNLAIAYGDIVYMDTDGKLNVDATNGRRYGYALGTVASGNTTTTIPVLIGY